MAFTLGLMGTLAGQNQQRTANDKERRDAARQQAVSAQQQSQFDAQMSEQQRQDAAQQSRYDAESRKSDAAIALENRLNGVGLVPSPEYLPPRNASPQQIARKQWLLAGWYEQNGATKRAAEVRQESRDTASSELALARADDIRYTRPAEFNAKLAQVDRNLNETLGAKKDALLANIASRQELAQFGAEARMDIARLAAQSSIERVQMQQGGALQRERETQRGANQRDVFNQSHADARSLNSQSGADYRAQLGDTTRATIAANADDVRRAIAEYTQKMTNARKGTPSGSPVDATNIGFPPLFGPAQAPINVNVYPNGGGSVAPPQFVSGDLFSTGTPADNGQHSDHNNTGLVKPPPIKGLPKGGFAAVIGAKEPIAPPSLDQKMIAIVQDAMGSKYHMSAEDARNTLTKPPFNKTPAQADAIMRAALRPTQNGSGVALPPIPGASNTQGGNGAATRPFP